jgi:hypothetical protein
MHRHQQAVVPREINGGDDICGPSAAGDERGPAVDHAIPDGTDLVVARVARAEEWTTQAGLESLHGGLIKHHVCPCDGGDVEIFHGFPPFGWFAGIGMAPNAGRQARLEAEAKRKL